MTEKQGGQEPGQLSLIPDGPRAHRPSGRRKRRSRPGTEDPAPRAPVARVLVDVALAHLDRPFDYLVPAAMHEVAVPGARVKVRFAGQDVDGFVLERVESSEHPGRLAPLRRAVSAEPVLTPAVARLSGSVAARYAGTRSDVLRLAVPPRHAAVEQQDVPAASPVSPDPSSWTSGWSVYEDGEPFVRDLQEGRCPRVVWSALPGEDWPARLAGAAAAAYAGGRGALLCLPDRTDVARVDAALTGMLGPGRHAVLTADAGPAARYRAFLSVVRGRVRVVVGTRAAAFAPVRDLGLVGVWDDGDDAYAEPRTPYPHTREVLLMRAHEQGAAVLVAGFARTAEGQSLVESGWAREVAAERSRVRAATPRVSITGATDRELARDVYARSSRLPREAFDAMTDGLSRGPVLVVTPRAGYVTGLACTRCRAVARCERCRGPLQLPGSSLPVTCRWCGSRHADWACPTCGGRELRSPAPGDRRTAEEVGRALPGARVRTSSGDAVLREVGTRADLVVATPGAEPVAGAGYACVVLLDTWLVLARTDLRTGEEALRRWLNAASLARPASEGGRVVAVGRSDEPVLQALLRWDPVGFARRELLERRSAHLPPASRLATLTGAPAAVEDAVGLLRLPRGAELLGPVRADGSVAAEPVEGAAGGGDGADTGAAAERVRMVIRVPRAAGSALSRALVEVQGVRDARKLAPVRVQVDPHRLG